MNEAYAEVYNKFPVFSKDKTHFVRRQDEVGIRGLLAFKTVCVVGVLMFPLAVYIIQVAFSGPISDFRTSNQMLNGILTYLRK